MKGISLVTNNWILALWNNIILFSLLFTTLGYKMDFKIKYAKHGSNFLKKILILFEFILKYKHLYAHKTYL